MMRVIYKDKGIIINILLILIGLYFFLFSIALLSVSFTEANQEKAESILLITTNPFISLFVGLLVTAIVQSSSTTTSLIVALVASGSISLQQAIPMMMGANIGTTITSAIVSLSFITQKKAFRKAVSAGVIHDIFNILITFIFFPLEYYYGFLSGLTQWLTNLINPVKPAGIDGFAFDMLFTRQLAELVLYAIKHPFISIVIAFLILFGSIKLLSKLLFRLLRGEFEDKFRKQLDNPLTALTWGTILTAAVQSSSITTSLVVPVVATNKLSVKKAFPFIMGANVGTTITAFLAAINKSDAAVSIAIAHFLFNILGVIIIFPFPTIRQIPVKIAKIMGRLTYKNRLVGFIYIFIAFFLIPFLLIYFSRNN